MCVFLSVCASVRLCVCIQTCVRGCVRVARNTEPQHRGRVSRSILCIFFYMYRSLCTFWHALSLLKAKFNAIKFTHSRIELIALAIVIQEIICGTPDETLRAHGGEAATRPSEEDY